MIQGPILNNDVETAYEVAEYVGQRYTDRTALATFVVDVVDLSNDQHGVFVMTAAELFGLQDSDEVVVTVTHTITSGS